MRSPLPARKAAALLVLLVAGGGCGKTPIPAPEAGVDPPDAGSDRLAPVDRGFPSELQIPPDQRPLDLVLPGDRPPPDVMPPPTDTRPPPPDTIAPSRSGLDPSRAVASLTDAELGRLCDWGVGALGGYGTVMFCTDGSQIRNSPSRESCIGGHDRSARCRATVADSEDCLWTLATLGCSQAIIQFRPSCQLMNSCQRP
jgi:hypothetical protein